MSLAKVFVWRSEKVLRKNFEGWCWMCRACTKGGDFDTQAEAVAAAVGHAQGVHVIDGVVLDIAGTSEPAAGVKEAP